jgi:hypothetical protein
MFKCQTVLSNVTDIDPLEYGNKLCVRHTLLGYASNK